jgi:hypothetical protein
MNGVFGGGGDESVDDDVKRRVWRISSAAYNTVKYTNALYLCKQMNVAPQTAILMDVRASYADTGESGICQKRIRTWNNTEDLMDSHLNTLYIPQKMLLVIEGA